MKPIPWWAVGAATAAPVLLVGGFLVGSAIQPASYNPVRDTISELAEQGATDWWLMTAALVGVGFCYVLAALGLQPAGRAGRALLATGGIAVLSIPAFRQPHRGYSLPHELAVIAAAVTCCMWPVFASRRRPAAFLLARAPSIAAVGVSLALATWYTLESNGPLLGLAERCAATVPPLWLLTVVVTTRHTLSHSASGNRSHP